VAAVYIVGDVFDRVAELRRRRVQVSLVLCSPPFLALRSYLPDGHPLKGSEIGSEATPAAFIDVMLALVAELSHVLAPWGSIAFELGDTYSGSGGAGGDYDLDGLRAGAPVFAGSAKARRTAGDFPIRDDTPRPDRSGRAAGWPESKSLAGIPQAFMLSLAYGYNVLDRRGPDSPAGRWRVRNVKPWIRSNPPVGALGDKERPATSYVTVATRDPARYFDLDAVRTGHSDNAIRYDRRQRAAEPVTGARGDDGKNHTAGINPAGAPPRDWWHHVDGVLDSCLDDMAGKTANRRTAKGVVAVDRNGKSSGAGRGGNWSSLPELGETAGSVGARGVHLRRALERAGVLRTVDALDVSPKGYKGAHYAVWPPELVRLLIAEMCPQRVCATCGQPSRRLVGEAVLVGDDGAPVGRDDEWSAGRRTNGAGWTPKRGHTTRSAPTLGWSDCGHGTWEPGLVLDPFVGSGTTLEVASGMGRRAIGIDLDYTNVALALERVGGLFLDVEWPDPDLTLLALGAGSPDRRVYDRWRPALGHRGRSRAVALPVDHLPCPRRGRAAPAAATPRPKRRSVPAGAGQLDLLTPGG
jgi:hypothetical protein